MAGTGGQWRECGLSSTELKLDKTNMTIAVSHSLYIPYLCDSDDKREDNPAHSFFHVPRYLNTSVSRLALFSSIYRHILHVSSFLSFFFFSIIYISLSYWVGSSHFISIHVNAMWLPIMISASRFFYETEMSPKGFF